jgi:hypothetical protein
MVQAGRLKDPAAIGVRADKVITSNKRKVARHFTLDIGEGSFSWRPRPGQHRRRGRLRGIYVIPTPVLASELPASATVQVCKDLSHVEQDFRISKDDLGQRPGAADSAASL